jgi:hypothetical protein
MKNIPSQTNTFEGGMNKDASTEVIQDGQYLDAMNVSFVSRDADAEGQTGVDTSIGRSFKITNLKSDTLYLTLPDIPEDRRRELCFEFTDTNWKIILDITFDSSPGIQLTADQNDGLLQLASDINDNHGDLLYAEVDCDCLVLKTTDWTDQLDTVSLNGGSVNVNVTITDISLPAQDDLEVIGWARAGTEFVLFTTDVDNEHSQENGTDDNVGQIWLFEVPVTGPITASLNGNLKYNDRLDFALTDPISGQLIIESDCRKRLIFTDRRQELRNIDLFPEGIIRTPPSLLSLQPTAKMGEFDFIGYASGELFQGVYHYAFRYKLSDGTATNWIGPSNHIVIAEPYRYDDGEEKLVPTGDAEASYDSFYTGKFVGSTSTKGIELSISNIDTLYPTIEVVAIYVDTEFGDPNRIYTIYEGAISGPQIEIDHIKNTTIYGTEYTLAELSLSRQALTGVHGITESAQRMIYANYCEPSTNIGFDQKIGTGPNDIGVEFFNLGFDANDIETIAEDSGTSSARFLYWRADNSDYSPPIQFSSIDGYNSVVSPLDPTLTNDIYGEKQHPQLGQIEHYFRSYMRGEAYRLGIVFYRKSDNSRTPVHWIGDVEIPYPTHDNTGPNDGECQLCQDGKTYPVYIRLTGIDVSGISDDISGFSIVRTKRSGRVVGMALEAYALATHPTNPVFPLHERIYLCPELDFSPTERQNASVAFSRIQDLSIRTLAADDREVYYDTTVSSTDYTTRFSLVNLMDGTVISPLVQTSFLSSIGYELQDIDPFVNDSGNSLMGAILCATEPGTTGTAATPVYPFPSYEPLDGDTVAPRIFDGTFTDPITITHEYYLNVIEDVQLRFLDVDELFGGDGEAALANTEYVDTGVFVPVDSCSDEDFSDIDVNVLGGDTYCTAYSRYMTTRYLYTSSTDTDANFNTFWLFPCETTHNVGLRHVEDIGTTATLNRLSGESDIANNGWELWDFVNEVPINVEVLEAFDISGVFNRKNGLISYLPLEALSETCEDTCYEQRVIPTNRQLYGSSENAFQQTLLNDAKDLDRRYGEIVEISTQGTQGSQQLMVWQRDAISYVTLNPKRLESTTGSEVVLGSGSLLDDPVYLSENVGCQHKWSVTRGIDGFYWVDANRRRVYKLTGSQISGVTTGMVQYMERQLAPMQGIDAPTYYGGIHCIYDYKHDWLIITTKYDSTRISNDLDLQTDGGYEPFTLVYSEAQQAFTSFLSHSPTMFIQLAGNRLISQSPEDTDNRLYLHFDSGAPDYGLFYGNSIQGTAADAADSYILFVVNKGGPSVTKIPNSFLAIQEKPWTHLEVASNKQTNAFRDQRYLRVRRPIADYANAPNFAWQPAGGKWLGPMPMATDYYLESLGVWNNNQTIERLKGEEIYIKLELIETNTYRDLFSVQTYFHPSKKQL